MPSNVLGPTSIKVPIRTRILKRGKLCDAASTTDAITTYDVMAHARFMQGLTNVHLLCPGVPARGLGSLHRRPVASAATVRIEQLLLPEVTLLTSQTHQQWLQGNDNGAGPQEVTTAVAAVAPQATFSGVAATRAQQLPIQASLATASQRTAQQPGCVTSDLWAYHSMGTQHAVRCMGCRAESSAEGQCTAGWSRASLQRTCGAAFAVYAQPCLHVICGGKGHVVPPAHLNAIFNITTGDMRQQMSCDCNLQSTALLQRMVLFLGHLLLPTAARACWLSRPHPPHCCMLVTPPHFAASFLIRALCTQSGDVWWFFSLRTPSPCRLSIPGMALGVLLTIAIQAAMRWLTRQQWARQVLDMLEARRRSWHGASTSDSTASDTQQLLAGSSSSGIGGSSGDGKSGGLLSVDGPAVASGGPSLRAATPEPATMTLMQGESVEWVNMCFKKVGGGWVQACSMGGQVHDGGQGQVGGSPICADSMYGSRAFTGGIGTTLSTSIKQRVWQQAELATDVWLVGTG